jgi:hypothetical protein
VGIASHRIAVTAARSFLRRKTAKASEHGAAAGDGDGDFFTQRSRRRSNAQLLPVPASPLAFHLPARSFSEEQRVLIRGDPKAVGLVIRSWMA